MRDELTAALQARWEESLADEATDGGDGVGEVEEGVDDFLAALVAALQPVEGGMPGVSPACQRCPAGSGPCRLSGRRVMDRAVGQQRGELVPQRFQQP
jgi:hypothetical protein